MERRIMWWWCILMMVAGLPGNARAQSGPQPVAPPGVFYAQLAVHHGFILVHSRDLVPVRHSNPSGITLDLGLHRLSRQAWQHCLCFPMSGLSLGFWDFDQPDILGQALTAQIYVEPLFAPGKRFSFSVRGGLGAAWANRPFHPVNNPLNQGYSTPLGISAQFGAVLHYRMAPSWRAQAGFLYNHISNGGVREPNKGINWPAGMAGIAWYPHPPVFDRPEVRPWRESGPPARRLDIQFFLGFQEPESKTYLFSPGIEARVSRQVSRISALSAGAEWVFHNGARFRMARDSINVSPMQVGLSVGHEFLLGKFIFTQQLGVYVFRPYRVKDDLFQRYSLLYAWKRNVYVGTSLKVYRHIADLLDIRAGWSF